jgi:hypothetical protein
MKKFSVVMLILMIGMNCLWALKIGGVMLPDSMRVGDKELILNGAGLRKKLIIKVYAGALYLPSKCSDAPQIAGEDEEMAIKMHFIYKAVSPEKLIEAWNTGFAKSNISNLQNKINIFNSFFTEDARKGDVYDIVYVPDQGTSLYINNVLKGTIEGLGFKKALFNIWLSENTELPDLRDAMLGK